MKNRLCKTAAALAIILALSGGAATALAKPQYRCKMDQCNKAQPSMEQGDVMAHSDIFKTVAGMTYGS